MVGWRLAARILPIEARPRLQVDSQDLSAELRAKLHAPFTRFGTTVRTLLMLIESRVRLTAISFAS